MTHESLRGLEDDDIVEVRVKKIETEMERLKAHTWKEERAAVVDYLRRSGDLGKVGLSKHCYDLCHAVEAGKHWTEGEKM